MRDAFICDAVRTPIGRYGGALAKVRTDDLAAVPIKALVERAIPRSTGRRSTRSYLGCANQAGEDNRNVARMALLLAGLPDCVPGVTVNRLCASGLNAVGDAARAIRCGEIDLAIAGGVESMTRAPLVMGKAQEAFQRSAEIHDTTLGWRFINPLMKQQYGVDADGRRPARTWPRNTRSRAPIRTPSRCARSSAPAGRSRRAIFAEEIVPVAGAGRQGRSGHRRQGRASAARTPRSRGSPSSSRSRAIPAP